VGAVPRSPVLVLPVSLSIRLPYPRLSDSRFPDERHTVNPTGQQASILSTSPAVLSTICPAALDLPATTSIRIAW
jgi:hypothetical protein